jgi:metal-dependent amidase/aminoacylase/carboxypeptidase family protein
MLYISIEPPNPVGHHMANFDFDEAALEVGVNVVSVLHKAT